MNSGIVQIVKSALFPSSPIWYTSVRNRYYAEKIAQGPIVKKFGYRDRVARVGPMPRLKDADMYRTPIYRPANSWTEEKARFGQNDYIDILGGRKLLPAFVSYDVPKWLRGKKGNEMQLLLLKQKVFNHTRYITDHPTAWYNMRRRVKYLYKYLNFKTKTSFMKD